MQRIKIALIILLVLCTRLFAGEVGEAIPKIQKPKLIVMIVVDQMRADHLTRFAGVYQHGFAKFYEQGAIFTNAHHEHAYTVTAVGHATISTGAFPSRHGIVGNEWFDRIEKKKVYCAEDTNAALLGYPDEAASKGRSPRRLLTSTFGDWLKSQSPKSKVFGVARKDRAAILCTGLKADGAFWYHNDDGNFITSEYYFQKYPEWADTFNKSLAVDAFYDKTWHKLLPEETYFLAREDTFATEYNGKKSAFPYSMASTTGKPAEDYYKKLETSPFLEKLVLDFAQSLVESERLGEDDAPDLLFIGCSGADAIGHSFGPLSQESMDYFLRLDEYLGEFFGFLDKRIGKENYLAVLSSDHGVLPIPEELSRRGFDAKRISSQEMIGALREALTILSEELQIQGRLITGFQNNALFVNYQLTEENGIAPEELDKKLIEKIKQIGFIADVFSKDELAMKSSNGRPYQDRFRHSFYPDRSGDLILRLKKHFLLRSSRGTSHGSPYNYDTHVPLVFAGAGIQSRKYSGKVRTVDIAPTIAEILGIRPAGEIDGRSLLGMILQK